MKMTGAEMVVKSLEKENIGCVFGLPGGTVIPLYDALYDASFLHVLMRHEQAACHAAEGYARIKGKAGVCIVTSGPGATNAITGLSNAMLDSVPLVLIAGHVANSMMGTDAFQEADIFGSSFSFVKHSFFVKKIEELTYAMKNAFALAESGRPGPVLITLPVDVQRSVGEFEYPDRAALPTSGLVSFPDPDLIKSTFSAIQDSFRSVILAGGGIVSSRASSELSEFAEKMNIPVATTLMGKGAFPESSNLSLGMAGMHGTPQANLAISNSDLLIAVGTRFSDRTTGNLGKFAPSARVIHVDIDESEFDKIRKADFPVHGDAGAVLKELSSKTGSRHSPTQWLDQIAEWKDTYPLEPEKDSLSAPLIIRKLREKVGTDCIVTTEVGQNQMWSALHWTVDKPGKFITSGGLGTMGFGFPAAIGASFARGKEPVVCVAGDGSLLMNLQELETCARYELPVKIFLLNNGTLGMVRQWQEMFANERYSHTVTGDKCNFPQIAEACGIMGFHVDSVADLERALETVFLHNGPVLVDCRIPLKEKVMPMVPPGRGLAEFLYR